MIHSMTEDKSGNIWFATRRHGICIYDGKKFTSFGESEVFLSYGVTTILEDKKELFGSEQIKAVSSPMMEKLLKIIQRLMD
ncbi:MAG: hypothetical protein IPF52_14990 [Saprospiraceae bacterium]|nr:hypothetical protein [Saprospiraceae bacterium]